MFSSVRRIERRVRWGFCRGWVLRWCWWEGERALLELSFEEGGGGGG